MAIGGDEKDLDRWSHGVWGFDDLNRPARLTSTWTKGVREGGKIYKTYKKQYVVGLFCRSSRRMP
jgi:hypothetical protein